ncbi:ParB-like nuclease domain-containing protein [Bradyrhizobium sp. Rc3b]|uniref:ParB N-terminal domain-containing protein n=1 Tax=Bradyrhizobium sp. Rc3b TaxID=1855322 RepID=UPI0008EEA596|nr:ParB N-terminal domain-containing protein [Bradyrhizobium sp. Rc3b]SFM34732.1 ParB-like nuclease domain-containing protein [Bradyrhizobium sp. Rc3b]
MAKKTNKKVQRAPRGPRVTRADIVMPKDSGKTAAELKADSEKAKPTQGPVKRSLPRSAIYVAEEAFQWRGGPKQDRWERENHIYTLAKDLRNQKAPLTRLLVWQVGKRFYVIDGHHRLGAYDTAKWKKDIPVEVFTGTLDQARLRAIAGNVRDKLRMTPGQKSAAAWRITKENIGNLTADEVAEHTTISRRTAFAMKQVWKELNARTDLSDEQREKLPTITWKAARDLREGIEPDADFDADTWKEKKAEEVAELIRRHNAEIGLLADIEIAAMALRMLSERLPEALIEEWAGDYPELITELAARITNPPPDLEF